MVKNLSVIICSALVLVLVSAPASAQVADPSIDLVVNEQSGDVHVPAGETLKATASFQLAQKSQVFMVAALADADGNVLPGSLLILASEDATQSATLEFALEIPDPTPQIRVLMTAVAVSADGDVKVGPLTTVKIG